MTSPAGSILAECRDGVWVLTMRGEHDISTVASLSDELGRAAAAGGPVIVDLTAAEFIDSSILRTLAGAAGQSGDGPVVVAPAGREPRRLVRLTGLDTVLRVYETCAAALEASALGTITPGLASPSDAS